MTTITKRNYPTNETLTRDASSFLYLDKDGLVVGGDTVKVSGQEVIETFECGQIPACIIDIGMELEGFDHCEVYSSKISERMHNNLLKITSPSDPRLLEFATHMHKYGMHVLTVHREGILNVINFGGSLLMSPVPLKEAA